MPDASFVSRALIRTQLTAAAVQRLETELAAGPAARIVAPYLLAPEFASALRQLELRGRLNVTECDRTWSDFLQLPIRLAWDPAWVPRAVEIARRSGLSKVYDSLYLACAEALDLPLLTCDARFIAALPETLRDRVEVVA